MPEKSNPLAHINSGARETAHLAEILRVDFATLMHAVLPHMGAGAIARIRAQDRLGIVARMRFAGQLILNTLGPAAVELLQKQPGDTARGWACFMLGAQPGIILPELLQRIRPFADDRHFGVREWAWLAIRPQLAKHLDTSIAHLAQWTMDTSPYIRRFAVEALRPRGVWTSHIKLLKQEPERAFPILQPLRCDTAVYVQDAVANWLNDATKTRPDWVRSLCQQWCNELPDNPHTRRICKRAQRSLKHP